MVAKVFRPTGRLAEAVARADLREGRKSPNRVRRDLARAERAAGGADAWDAALASGPGPISISYPGSRDGDLVAKFSVGGEPVAWARARQCRDHSSGRVKFYTKPEQAAAKRHIAQVAKIAVGASRPHAGALELIVVCRMGIPPSWTVARRQAAAQGLERPTGKPDADNFAKLVKDALTGVVWVDDAQVVGLAVSKFYTAGDPGTDITVREAFLGFMGEE